MTSRAVEAATRAASRRDAAVSVCFEGGSEGLMRAMFGNGVAYRPQYDGDLGEKMRRALDESFERGASAAILAGCDCPAMTAALLESALELLKTNDVVLGPARDGGYYLIGLRKRPAGELFRDMPWGSQNVRELTLAAARRLGLSTAQVQVLDDVDRPEDMGVCETAVPGEAALPDVEVSVIVPALNEAERIACALEVPLRTPGVEAIVVDGESADGTPAIAKTLGARVIASGRGRARQLNAGAAAARGDALVFLHADSVLPVGFEKHVKETLARPGVAAGAFRFKVDKPLPGMGLVERLVNFRGRRMQAPYGDQALFVRASIFREAGGFPEMPIMDDCAFVKRVRRLGRIAIAPAAVVTSARRWERLGVFRTTLVNQLVLVGYAVGVSPERLARLYGRGAGRRAAGQNP